MPSSFVSCVRYQNFHPSKNELLLLYLNARDSYPHKPSKQYKNINQSESLNCAPSEYHLFRSMVHALAEKRFNSYEDIEKWISDWITSKDKSFLRRGIHLLPEKWEKVIANDGQYFD
ncbi:Mariner Mos1 transposase [Anthophora plagiata]